MTKRTNTTQVLNLTLLKKVSVHLRRPRALWSFHACKSGLQMCESHAQHGQLHAPALPMSGGFLCLPNKSSLRHAVPAWKFKGFDLPAFVFLQNNAGFSSANLASLHIKSSDFHQ